MGYIVSTDIFVQLGQNHATFVEKICTMLDDMINALPAYGEYVDQVQSKTD